MPKYYAVKIGRIPGVYDTWDACKKQVDGFSGAIYKSFTNLGEARSFVTQNQSEPGDKVLSTINHEAILKRFQVIDFNSELSVEKSEDTNTVNIYTDGSHQRSRNYLGIGAFCSYKRKEYSLSLKCDGDMLNMYDIDETNCSNPTAELLGFAEVLKVLKDLKVKPTFNIVFHIDYIGVKCWIEGTWQARETYIIKIRDECLKLMKQIGCQIRVNHIRGHTGIYGNERADKLAGDLNSFNNFHELISVIEDSQS